MQQLSVPLPPGPQFVIPGPPGRQLGGMSAEFDDAPAVVVEDVALEAAELLDAVELPPKASEAESVAWVPALLVLELVNVAVWPAVVVLSPSGGEP